MNRSNQSSDDPCGFDYQLHRIDGLPGCHFRGPPVDLEKPYLAFVGGAETFGCFTAAPFPALLRERLHIQTLNLGVGGARPQHFNTPRYLELLNRAEAVVFQIGSSQTASYSESENPASGCLGDGTPPVDEQTVSEDRSAIAAGTYDQNGLYRLFEERRRDHLNEFIYLLRRVRPPRILLWLSQRAPASRAHHAHMPQTILGPFPPLIDSVVVAELAAFCDSYVECVSTTGLPQITDRTNQAIDGTTPNQDVIEDRYHPSPQIHTEVAEALESVCSRFCGRPAATPRRMQSAPDRPTRFVIVGAERTGTNLLISLLNQQPQCICGNELFNQKLIETDVILWPRLTGDEHARLLDLRRSDPGALLHALCEKERTAGREAIGFKLLYSHGIGLPPLLNALAEDRSLRVIHLTRRNLLRRLISHRQAQATGEWGVRRGVKMKPRPPVEISVETLFRLSSLVEQQQQYYDAMFSGHSMLRLVYEDMAADPGRVAARAARFLDLRPAEGELELRLQRTGSDSLSDAVVGFAELRARLRRWADFADD